VVLGVADGLVVYWLFDPAFVESSMPRIELIPSDFDESTGNGTPTMDVCKNCIADHGLEEGEEFPFERSQPSPIGELGAITTLVGSTDVDHPPYEELASYGDPYHCPLCGKELGQEDN
jgi:hypothetical protein